MPSEPDWNSLIIIPAYFSGHLQMVKYLLKAGADQEHKTDEMHTALMEASMVSVAIESSSLSNLIHEGTGKNSSDVKFR